MENNQTIEMPLHKIDEFCNAFSGVFVPLVPNLYKVTVSIVPFDASKWTMELRVKITSKKGVPYGKVSDADYRKIDVAVEKAFLALDMSNDRFMYMGVDESSQEMCWYSYHPEIPNELLPEDIDYKKLMSFLPSILVPKVKMASNGEIYLTLDYEHYDAIKNGTKKVEYRTYNQYYVNRILGSRIERVKFQRGYGSRGVSPEQMTLTISSIKLLDEKSGVEKDAVDASGKPLGPSDFPTDFRPTAFAIHLGEAKAKYSVKELLDKVEF